MWYLNIITMISRKLQGITEFSLFGPTLLLNKFAVMPIAGGILESLTLTFITEPSSNNGFRVDLGRRRFIRKKS
jgi:hypothetical protein